MNVANGARKGRQRQKRVPHAATTCFSFRLDVEHVLLAAVRVDDRALFPLSRCLFGPFLTTVLARAHRGRRQGRYIHTCSRDTDPLDDLLARASASPFLPFAPPSSCLFAVSNELAPIFGFEAAPFFCHLSRLSSPTKSSRSS